MRLQTAARHAEALAGITTGVHPAQKSEESG